MKSNTNSSGKGDRARSNWSKEFKNNYSLINWAPEKKWCAFCGIWSNHSSGSCSILKKHLKENG